MSARRARRCLLLPLLLLASAGGVLHAREAASPASATLADETYFLDEAVPVVLSATRLAQPQYESPASVTIIDRDMIRASGALDIPDLLWLVPGFQVGHARVHTLSASYHGLADERARRMQVLVDGRPVYSPSTGGVRWMELPLDISDVERIEVIRGPNAAAYGANSFLGAINIITQHPAELQGTEAAVLAGNKGNRKLLLRHGGRAGRLQYRFTLSGRRDDGFEPRFDIGPPAPNETRGYPRDPLDDGMRVPLFDLRTEYPLAGDATLELLGGYNGGTRRTGAFDDAIDSPRDERITSHFEQLVYRRSPDAGRETRLQLYHTYLRTRSATDTVLRKIIHDPGILALLPALGIDPDTPVHTDFGITEQRLEGELTHHQTPRDDLRFLLGASYRLDRVRGANWFSRDSFIVNHLYRLFGNLEYHPSRRGVMNLGLMIEKTTQVGTRISPRLAYNHQLTPHHGLRLSLSRAYRLPTLYEEHVDGSIYDPDGNLLDRVYLGNPDLAPEYIRSAEIGYLGHFPELHTILDVKLFREEIGDRITGAKNYPEPHELHPDQRTIRFANSPGHSLTRGVEVSLNWRPDRQDQVLFNWAYADSDGRYLKNYEFSADDPSQWILSPAGNQVPRHTFSIFVMHRFAGRWEGSALYHRTGKMKWLGNGDYLGPQERLDLRLARTFSLPGGRLEVSLVGQNVLHESLDFRNENVVDTRVYGQLALKHY